MESRRRFLLLFTGAIAFPILLLAGCGGLELDSGWRDREITVDGASTDWQDALLYVERANVAVGLLNDER